MTSQTAVSSPLPLQLQPVIRVASHVSGIDSRERLRECYSQVLPSPVSEDDLAHIVDLPLFDVPSTAELMAALDRASQRLVRIKAQKLTERLAPHLPPACGTVIRNEVSCITAEQQGYPRGTVVLVRESDQVTEQYLIRFIRIDPSDGGVSAARIPEKVSPSADSQDIRPMADAGNVASQLIGAGMAVTPFLPPPYNVAATATLALTNLIIGWLKDAGPQPPSPFDTLKNSLESYITDDDIRAQQGILRGVNDHFGNQASSQTQPIDNLISIDGGIKDLENALENRFIPDAEGAIDQLYSILLTRNTDSYGPCLATLTSGITLDLVLQNGLAMIGAVDASIAYRHKDMDQYDSAMSSWLGRVKTITKDIGTSRTDPWDDAAIGVGLDSASYVPKIEAWMAKAKKDRLAKITDTHRGEKKEASGDAYLVYSGWTFADSHEEGDGGELANLVVDDPGDGCCADPIQHKDIADANRAAYVTKVSQQVDNLFAPHRQVMATWATFIAGLHELLPPDAPPKPASVGPMKGGASVPQGEWVEGAQVRYALTAVNTKGPSPSSDWSDPMTVGRTAFTTIGGFGPAPTADTLQVYRQIMPPRGAWGARQAVGVVMTPLPTTYDDQDTGGDDW